ncbi:MAG: hypothetical protein HWD85_08750 [Flavobacteriaceae bacterium]|nr:hypothetical protein [Flavobacteriaceae bacterium]
MKEIENLIDHYLTTRNVYGAEDALEKMVELTTRENYLHIINYIENKDVKKHELDLSMYIVEIACKEYQDLIPIINSKLKEYSDNDAIEDLENALKKINA